MDDVKTQTREAAQLIRQGLTQLGHCYRTKDGDLVEVSFAGVQFVGDAYALVEVDTRRLPPRVSIAQLVHPDTLHHLTAVVGRPVKRLNTTGLTYCVVLKPQEKQRLPRRVDLDLSHRPAGEYMIGFGLSREGEVWEPLEKLCHMVVAGSTNAGKSAFLRSLLYQLVRQPLPVELYLTDMEGLTFAAFEGMPQLAHPIAGSVKEATKIAFRLVQEMERRAVLYQATGCFPEKLSEYHQAVSTHLLSPGLQSSGFKGRKPRRVGHYGPGLQIQAERGEQLHQAVLNSPLSTLESRLPWIVAVFDEFTALVDEAGKNSDLYRLIGQLAMRGRKYGITLVLAGQDFKADLLNTRITNQLRTRVQFGCATAYQSQVVLGRAGAEKITVPGRALVSFGGKIVEVQTFWVDKGRISEAAKQRISKLSAEERALVRYALEKLGGRFHIRALAEAFRGRVSQRRIEGLSRAWEARGWLVPGPTRADGKTINDELKELADAP